MSDTSYVIIGKIGKVHGVRGWLKLNSFTQPITNILDYNDWEINRSGNWQTMMPEKTQLKGEKILVKFADFNHPEIAKQLTNCLVRVKRSALPKLPEGEYYWSDLEGLNVLNQDNVALGKVSHLMETASNNVLVVKNEKKEHLIPYIKGDFVTKVDLEKQEIHVIWDPEF